jgi:hypothetical protein
MKTSYKTILDIQIATKSQVDDIHDEDDLIKLSLSVITIHLAKLVPILTKLSINKDTKVKPETLLKELGKVIEYTFILCNSCNFDIPKDEFLADYAESIPLSVKNDSVLTVMGMIGAVADLFHIIYVDYDIPPWSNEALALDLEDVISTIIVGMKHLGDKHGFTPDDVLAQFS